MFLKAIVIDDAVRWRTVLTQELQRELKHVVASSESYGQAAQSLYREFFHLALVDLCLVDGTLNRDGFKILEQIQRLNEGTVAIILSSVVDATEARDALLKYSAFDVIEKKRLKQVDLSAQVAKAITKAEKTYAERYSGYGYKAEFFGGPTWTDAAIRAMKVRGGYDQIAKFLDELLKETFPLIPENDAEPLTIDLESGMATIRCWSKFLATSLHIRFGRRESVESEERSPNRPPNLELRQVCYPNRSPLGGLIYTNKSASFNEFMSELKIRSLIEQLAESEKGGENSLAKSTPPREEEQEVRRELEAKRNLLRQWKGNLWQAEEKKAKYGMDVPVAVTNELQTAQHEIELLEDEIEELEKTLAQYGGA